jgi:hypothetical protein
MTHARHILSRVGLVLAVAVIAVLCLSSGLLAAIVGIVTAVVVAIDMIWSRDRNDGPPPAGGDKLSVDLSRRQ